MFSKPQISLSWENSQTNMVHSEAKSAAAAEGGCMHVCSLQHSAHEYRTLIRTGKLTSEALVNSLLDQISRHNHSGMKLNAVLSVCPRNLAVAQAKKLDEERRRGDIRSDLHGIPIVLKASTCLAGSYAFYPSASSCCNPQDNYFD